MITFIIGLVILFGGGYLYSKHCEKVFGPDDRETPAIAMQDGVDYVPMKMWKNSLINLLNIAGTGPVLGPIQGILFGPLAFITIPVGNVLAGAMHDYFIGMVSLRNKGAQMPLLVKKYLGNTSKSVYNVIVVVLMLLVGSVFIYTPGDLIVTELIGQVADKSNPTVWIVYGAIFVYYLIATLFPIDKIIGRIYPAFGLFLVLSAVGIFIGIIFEPHLLDNLTFGEGFGVHQLNGAPLIPAFFVTVACGILSGFHATQVTMISRSVTSEREARMTFYNMMIVEGFIAMCWAAGAMILFNSGTATDTGATLMVGLISRKFLGNFLGAIAVLGVIVLPITSGDTALRSVRLILAEQLGIDQANKAKRIGLTTVIFIPVMLILLWAKFNPAGFNLLWQYFAFTNQFIAIFALSIITVYLNIHGKPGYIALIPGMFYSFVVMSFIFNAKIGFNLDKLLGLADGSYMASYVAAAIFTAAYAYLTVNRAKKHGMSIEDHDVYEGVKRK